jgi:hypothetical protein
VIDASFASVRRPDDRSSVSVLAKPSSLLAEIDAKIVDNFGNTIDNAEASRHRCPWRKKNKQDNDKNKGKGASKWMKPCRPKG